MRRRGDGRPGARTRREASSPRVPPPNSLPPPPRAPPKQTTPELLSWPIQTSEGAGKFIVRLAIPENGAAAPREREPHPPGRKHGRTDGAPLGANAPLRELRRSA